MSPTLGKKQYLLLGKMLVLRKPELAAELLRQVSADNLEKDLSKIPEYYRVFCGVVNIDPREYRGQLNDTTRVDVRRLFVGVMLHLYAPEVYLHPSHSIILPYGLRKALLDIFDIHEAYMSRLIRQTIAMEKNYEWFQEKVNETFKRLTPQTPDNGN